MRQRVTPGILMDPDAVPYAAIFRRKEDTPSYFHFVNKLIQQRGLPLAIYSDRHPIFKFTGDTDRYPAGPTQFARSMERLGVRKIFARSPQAKDLVSVVVALHNNRSQWRLTAGIIVADSSLTIFWPLTSTIFVSENTSETSSVPGLGAN